MEPTYGHLWGSQQSLLKRAKVAWTNDRVVGACIYACETLRVPMRCATGALVAQSPCRSAPWASNLGSGQGYGYYHCEFRAKVGFISRFSQHIS